MRSSDFTSSAELPLFCFWCSIFSQQAATEDIIFRQQRNSKSCMADSDNESGGQSSHMTTREQDRLLPIANVSGNMKKALPANAKILKEAKETVQECVSEYISFITGEASEKCQREKRKTINGDDLLWAMTALGFEDYVEPLKIYLSKFREMEGEKMNLGRVPQQGDGGDYSGQGYGGMGYGMNMMQPHQQQQQQQQQQMYESGGFDQGAGRRLSTKRPGQ